MIIIHRVYEVVAADVKYCVLIDRLWPRGITRQAAYWDEWIKDIAPGEQLRKWFNHEAPKWDEFKLRYAIELSQKQELLQKFKNLESKYGKLALVYAAKDSEHNHAMVVKEILEKM